ncbi:MAG: riboflavin biosynthesis protein RibF [Candidatus Brocadiae bacterium]|nr:riboflavin biosynthesis protein RibF [Candidatus Brocadiia bacterium]
MGLPAGRLAALKAPVVSFGVFDGVHIGHQAVLAEVVAWARSLGGAAVAMTFDPHPQAVLRGAPVPTIASVDRRLELLEAAGADAAIVLPFTLDLARLSPDEFLDRFLVRELHAAGLILGFDQRFGHLAAGNFEAARSWGKRTGVEVRRGPEVVRGGVRVSSSAARMAIAGGRLDDAEAMLGRPAELRGTVVRGEGRGRQLGFPTANLRLDHGLVPPRGVYAGRSVLDGRTCPAVLNIGVRPTFSGGREEVVEVHLPGWSGDLYGRTLLVHLRARLRDEGKFESVDDLKRQIALDIEGAMADFRKPADAGR